jgi:DNA modification methylase
VDRQLGSESTPDEYAGKLVEVFSEVRRVLKEDGTFWLNLGDSYCNTDKWGGGGPNTGKQTVAADGSVPSWDAVRQRKAPVEGLKPKDLVGIPWTVAFALRKDGWWLRSEIIWAKPNVMPESVKDRPTKAHEQLFLLTKSDRYFYDVDAIREPFVGKNEHDRTGGKYAAPGQTPHSSRLDGSRGSYAPEGRNARTVWSITTKAYKGAHFATFPEELPRRCILAGSRAGDLVLDPFAGSGTTCAVARSLGRSYLGIELNPEYVELARQRLSRSEAAE